MDLFNINSTTKNSIYDVRFQLWQSRERERLSLTIFPPFEGSTIVRRLTRGKWGWEENVVPCSVSLSRGEAPGKHATRLAATRGHLFLGGGGLTICRQCLWRARRGVQKCGLLIWISEERGETEGEGSGGPSRTTAALIKTVVSLEVALRVVSKWKSKYRRACRGRRVVAKHVSLFPLNSSVFSRVRPRVKIADRPRSSQPGYSSFVKLESSLRPDIGSESSETDFGRSCERGWLY